MVLGVNQSVGLLVVIISVITYFTVKNSLIYSNDPIGSISQNDYILFIGITSAQDHFEKRLSIRRTWLKLINSEHIKYYFLVGKLFCNIPPKYRLSLLSCEEWKPVLNHNTTNETIFQTMTKEEKCIKRKTEHNVYRKGFTFIVNHKIIVQQFGIKVIMIKKCNGPVKLTLLDAVTLNRIMTSTFFIQHHDDIDIIWNKIPRTILPSGFEGHFILDGDCGLEETDVIDSGFALNDETNMIRFLLDIDSKNRTSPNVDNLCADIGFSFSIKDIDTVHNMINERNAEWLKWEDHIKKMSDRLNNEIITYGDILLLNIVDVYHNLPLKMLQFYQWLNPNEFKYVLKTDDDVFIDVPTVVRELKMFDIGTWNWWSCFRADWPVQKAGKWRELYVNLTVYPNFPSGAGYILNDKVVNYIKENTERLSLNIQGEDVAIGLWLQELEPKKHTGYHCQWSCDNRCHQGSCNVMELSVSDMLSVWEEYLVCNNSLTCLCN